MSVTWFLPVCHDCEMTVGRPCEQESRAEKQVRAHNRREHTDAVGNVSSTTEVDTFEAGYLGNKFPGKRPTYRERFPVEDADGDTGEAEA